MKIKFYTNAGLEIITDKAKILCDPWFIPGAFDGSWWQWPPLITKPEELTDYTHIYISHIHPDHCDLKTLVRLKNKEVPIILLKSNEEFLKKRILSCGFKNIVELKDGETFDLGHNLKLTMYGAFTPNVFIEDAEIPNIIDSSIVVSSNNSTVFNCNDNVPNKAACERIKNSHKEISLALLPYSGVGPYPSSYDNLTLEEKKKVSENKKNMYLERLLESVAILKPKLIVPCAGQMILAGKQYEKNKVLGVPNPEAAKELLEKNNYCSEVMREGDVLDLDTLKTERFSGNINVSDEDLQKIKQAKYWWEDAFNVPKEERIELLLLLKSAYRKMRCYQQKYAFFKDWYIGITIADDPDFTYIFSIEKEEVKKIKTNELFNSKLKFLQVKIPYSYLIAILTRHCHWNNAYHGCLVEWYRRPDEYLPEIQMLLSYFHL